MTVLTTRPGDALLGLDERHERIRAVVGAILDEFPEPLETEPDVARMVLLRRIYAELGRRGVLGGIVSVEAGGAGMSYTELAAAVEEAAAHVQVMSSMLAFASASIGTVFDRYATAAQRERFLMPTLRGEAIAAMGFTEPEGGSDVANLSTVAERDGDDFVVTGTKVWVDWAPEADWFLLFAQADPAAGRRGVSAFLIDPREVHGIATSSMGRKLGFREYVTGRVELTRCRLGPDALLGTVGDGLAIARTALEDARVFVAARLCGSLAACLHEVRGHARVAGVTRADELYLTEVATMATDLDCARHLTYLAAAAKDAGADAGSAAMRAKLVASEALARATAAAVRLIGPAALLDTSRTARLFRDAKVSGVTAGSDEIMRRSLAQQLLA
jgi:alkylation response protein AidB-like acyl-CoA dehydrogenase